MRTSNRCDGSGVRAPRGHPKSKPFVDHVFQFSYCDRRIWFRNYQLVDAVEHGALRHNLLGFLADIVSGGAEDN